MITLLIIVAEFALLVAIYDRGDDTRAQRIVAARVDGQVQHADAAQAVALVRQASRADEAGISTADWAPVVRAASELSPGPASTAGLTNLRDSVHRLEARLAARSETIDAQSRYIYAGLLLFVSLCWTVWFRRLIARHRSLERRVTEAQAVVLGEHRLAELIRNSTDLVAVLDADSTVRFTTESIESVLGIPAETTVGTQLIDHVVEDDVETFVRVLASTDSGDDRSLQVRMTHADGRTLHIEGALRNLVSDPAVGGFVLTVRDVTDRIQLEQQLTHQALHDPLTGLANRRLFADRLQHALDRRARTGQDVAVLFCDLDDFKEINDSLGHGAGDHVLTAISSRCNEVVRSGDTIARFGGDEFAILMEDADPGEATQLAERLIAGIGRPVDLDGSSITPRVSIGVAAVRGTDDEAVSGEELLRNADVAMYLAKERGKGGYAVYQEQMHERAMAQLRLRTQMQHALRNDEFVLHFQPTVDLQTQTIVGFEALVRWNHPERGMVPPSEFIPAAEEFGLIVGLGTWVLRQACAAGAALQGPGRPVAMSVNVAAAQLAQDDFTDIVLDALRQSRMPAQYLVLEITESTLLQNMERVVAQLTALREIGVRVAIDDFGTGYSSLRYLQQLPIDVLKIDKSFVDHVADDDYDASLTEAIIAMSRSLNMSTVAEGVEKTGQVNWLDRAQCDFGQGFLWSRPVPFDDAAGLLDRTPPASEAA